MKRSSSWLMWLVSFAAGVLFAVGLTVSGMTNPDKVRGFLNLAGLFDQARFGPWLPDLTFVMLGAVIVASVAYFVLPRHLSRPWFAATFAIPTRVDIDKRLVGGAVLFGVGWGISGYCPGPALASILSGGVAVGVFFIAMLAGMFLAKKVWR
ncbi:MAG: DUF6691 family protein [Formosimonas sp.]|jgi:uncharacterized membrane protein YedE/YeeE